MLYSYIVKKRIRQSFDHLNNHRWDEVLKAVAPNVHHRLPGANALGGERHDKETLRRWFERLGRVLRPKGDGRTAHFYTVVARDTVDADFAAHRQRFLAEQGYAYRILDAVDL